MTLHGRFYLNKADYAPLIFPGVGTFPAFSGDKTFRNQPGCTYLIDKGAIPNGKYWIVTRPSGGVRTQFWRSLFERWSRVGRDKWFALCRDDGTINDNTFINGIKRGNFRLHSAGTVGFSQGCITMSRMTDFLMLHTALMRTSMVEIPGSDLLAYGTIEVIADEEICPFDN